MYARRLPCGSEGKDWSYRAASQGMSRIKNQKLESSKEEFYPEPHREHGPGDILIFKF